MLAAWEEDLRALSSEETDLAKRERIEDALDAGYGSCLLKQAAVAQVVENALLFHHEKRYTLHAWVVMPNHVHVLMTPEQGQRISAIIHSWKSYTSHEVNKLLDREGVLWQADYFDRMIRNGEHFERTIKYIEQNPVKAGLAGAAEEWPFSSATTERDTLGPHPRAGTMSK